MKLLVFMYHRAVAGAHGNDPQLLDAHFAHVAARCACVLPGESLHDGKTNVCLSFDDATYDFYAIAMPLLEKHGLRALLAVAPGLVRERVAASRRERLEVRYDPAHPHPGGGAFCTWPELRELADSGRVAIAAHGYTHCRLDRANADLETEIAMPQSLLSTRLNKWVTSFVFPYGRISPRAYVKARLHYNHLFRIGSGGNQGWNGRLTYRIDADAMARPESLFAPSRRIAYRARYYWNRLRGR